MKSSLIGIASHITGWPRLARRITCLAALACGVHATSAQTIAVSTLAGQPNSPGVADGTGGAARFNSLQGIAVDGAGNLYIADTNNHTIRKVTSAGVVSTIAGSAGTSGTADGSGNSGATPGPARFNSPEGVAVNAAGTLLWVADTFNHTIRAIDLTTNPVTVSTLAGTAGAAGYINNSGAAARFRFPVGIAFDGTNLYVVDQGNQNIRKVTTAGAVSWVTGPDDSSGNAVQSFAYVDSATAAAVRFKNPFHIAVDNTRLFVADKGNNVIRVVTISSGAVATLAGTGSAGSADAASGPATSATFSGPGGVAVDSTGSSAATTVYVADSINHTIRKIVLSSGVVSTIGGVAGSGTFADGLGSVARFSGPLGITADATGNLYIADTLNHLVRKATPTVAPSITSGASTGFTVGAAGTFTVTANGSPAATFSVTSGSLPTGVTLTTNAGANTATLAGTPTVAGSFPFTIQASNGVGTAATQSFTLTVNEKPVFTTANHTAFAVNAAGTFQVTARGAPTPTYSITSGTLPSSVASLASDGLLTAMPPSSTAGSPFIFVITAHNSAGDTEQEFTLTIQNGAAISVQPVNQTVKATATATFSVTASGTPAPNSYQWYRKPAGGSAAALSNGGSYSGATTATLTVSGATLTMDQDEFYCVVGNGVGSDVTSQSATLRVGTDPVFTSSPSTTFVVNTAGTFQVTASGTPAPTYSITSGSLPSSVANLNSAGLLTAAPPSSTTGTPFTFVITATNLAGSVTQNFTLNVSATPVTPTVTTQPTNQTVGLGQTATFTITAAGDAPLTYQWQRQAGGSGSFANVAESAPYSGTTTATLTIDGTTTWMSGDAYRCVVTNSLGSTTSSSATLTLSLGTTFSTVAGQAGVRGATDGTGSAALFSGPSAIAVDSAGNAYIADSSNHVIRKVTSTGVVTTVAGMAGSAGSADGVGSAARFNSPQGIAIDATGILYVADSGNHTIRVIYSGGLVNTLAGVAGAMGSADGSQVSGVSTARFAYPTGIAVDSVGSLYVADSLNHTVRKVTTSGTVITFAGAAGVRGTADGTLTGGVSSARLAYPNSVAVDSIFNVYVADAYNQTIRKISPAGTVTTLAGTAGITGALNGNGAAARFNQPDGVAVDSSGNVYVADAYNHLIRKITSTGDVTTVAGTAGVSGSTDGSGTAVKFNSPYGVAVDSSGNIWVADTFNHTIRRSGALAAPSITTQPQNSSVIEGQAASFTVAATGSPTPSYQWQRQPAGTSGFTNLSNDSTYSGVNSATLTVTGTTLAMSGDQFQVLVNNLVDSGVTSSAVTLTVGSAQVAPTITTQPASATTVNLGESATLTVTATGTGTLSYQWRKDGAAIAGATSASFTIANAQASSSGIYTVVVSNAYGSTASSSAVLAVNTPPTILTQPRSQTVIAGNTAVFTTSVTGASGITYQWRKNGAAIAGATSASHAVVNASATDGGAYDVVVTNSLGSAKSSLAQLTVVSAATAPVLTAQPASRTVIMGSTVTLTADASAAPAPTYQWRKNGVAISGATNATLTLSNVQGGDAANYDVIATNSAGSVTSSAGALRVIARSFAGTYFGTFGNGLGNFAMFIRDDNTGVFLGYIPTSTAPIMSVNVSVNDAGEFSFMQSATTTSASDDASETPVRAAALSSVLVNGTIGADGSVSGTISGGAGASISATRSPDTGSTQNVAGFYMAGAANSGSTTLTITSASGQAFALTQVGNATDGGLGAVNASGQVAVATGRTTITEAINSSTGNITGGAVGALNASFTGANENVLSVQRLANISTRARVGTGDSIAIAGFVISGTESKPVLIRAVGPTLSGYGVSGVLATPKLELYRSQTVIASNTGVATSANSAAIAAAGAQVGAFALSTGADSAILITLPPGGYTAQVSSTTATAGIALVEVYDLSAPAAGQKLLNISTRASASSGDNTLIAGVAITGSSPKRVLIRGVGPGLAVFGVSGTLAQPVLTLKTQDGSQTIAQNTGWTNSADSAAILTASTQSGGFPLVTGDSAMIVTLNPGLYSAQVTGANGTSGIAIVEVYELQ